MAVVECKCSKEHKCPLFTAIKACSVTKEEQILEQKYDLVRYLLTHGATIRF